MFTKNYESMNENLWQGRIDSYDNYDAFRWHQWVKPLDLKRDDLKPLEGFGFAFLGFCCDEGVKNNKGRSGAMNGPIGIRHELAKMPCTFNKSVQLFDAGDIVVDAISLDEGQNLLSQGIKKLLSLNIFLLSVPCLTFSAPFPITTSTSSIPAFLILSITWFIIS